MPYRTRYAKAAQMFAIDCAEHGMTIEHDDGLYRHLRFRRPDTGLYWFSLITWPGSLCFHGDMGTFVFSRVEDMTEFFATGRDINPGYWGEKVQSGEIRRYSEDTAREHVNGEFREYANEHGWVLTSTVNLWDELCSQVLDEEIIASEDLFRSAVRDFDWGMGPLRFRFSSDAYWDWDLRDFTQQFLWACFAVQHGVNRYRASKAGSDGPVPTPVQPPVRPTRDLAAVIPAPPAVQLPAPSGTGEVTKIAKKEYL